MLLSYLFSLSLALTPISSTPISSGEDAFENIEARAASTFAITGAPSGVYPRLDIHSIQKNADQWNLYLLAMQAFQAVNQTTLLSYYQIAGIHGVPNIPWDNVAANPSASNYIGYCTHSSILFPAWHRAYLTLVEQVFYNQVQAVVATFPAGAVQNRYAAAAANIRLPYWDWAAEPPSGLPTLPYVLTETTISVTTPTGPQTIINPLVRYQFHPLVPSDMIYDPWADWGLTHRWPNSNSSANAASQQSLAVAAMENNRLNLRDNLYNMFTLCTQFPEFSNDGSASSTAGCSNSLEGIHDTVHGLIGGSNYGHMSYLAFASFDPIFWLHHANVDRLFAMWQGIYPKSYTQNQVASGTTFTIASGSTQGVNSPLTPFHRDTTGDFHTSTTVRNWTNLHYTYPEFADSDGSSSAIIGYVNALYGPSATATAGSSKAKRTEPPTAPIVQAREVPTDAATPDVPTHLLTTPSGERIDYIANVHAHRFGLDGSFSIYIFLGDFTDDAADWPFEPALVGTHAIISSRGMTGNPLSVSGAVPLTRALTQQVASGALADMSAENVVPFLTANMHWRVATTSNVAIQAANVPGLQVSVVTANSTVPTNHDVFPTWSSFNTLTSITHGRAGGFSANDQIASDAAREWRENKWGKPVGS